MLLDEHVPPRMGLILEALGHSSKHVIDLGLRGVDDGHLVRALAGAESDWLLTTDLYREPEVWSDVYTALAEEGLGRVIRVRPSRRRTAVAADIVIADFAAHLVDAYAGWSHWLTDQQIVLIDLGRGGTTRSKARTQGSRGPRSFTAYTRREVGQLLQQNLLNSGGPRGEGC